MASLMEDLIDVLNKEEEQYQGLIELGKKKREVVIRADIKTLDEITATSGGTAGRAETAHGSKGAAVADRKRDGSH